MKNIGFLKSTLLFILIAAFILPNFKILAEENLEIISIRINRLNTLEMGIKNHQSEIALDNYQKFNYIIDNNFGLEQLREQAERLVSKYVN